jgi:putative tricarboxylic transport membrane protein
MFHEVAQGFQIMVQPSALIFMLIGIVFGLIVGATPGLGGIVCLTIILPFLYEMKPGPGLGLTVGAYTSVLMGGSVPSILLNIPGTAEQVVTTFDGYPLTKKGEGSRALGISAASNVVGGLVSALTLIIVLPIVRPLVIHAGAPLLFVVSLLAVTTVGVLNAGAVSKGIVAGLLGLMLSFIGFAPITGESRFTFGSLSLYDGLGVGALVLGLFAVSTMLGLYVNNERIVSDGVELGSGETTAWTGVRDVVTNWRRALISAAIGTVAGLLHGGGTVAMYLSYGHARASSKHPERFGQGEPIGVIAAEVAGMAKEGGALVPTLAVGIPGSSAMAVFIAMLVILGIQPGPEMLVNNRDIIYYITLAVPVAATGAAVIALLLARSFVRVASVPPSILVPVVFSIAALGGFIENQLTIGVWVAFVAGGVAYWLKELDYPPAGIALGFVLGPFVERYLFISINAYGTRLLYRPEIIGGASLVVLLLLRIWWMRSGIRQRRIVGRSGRRTWLTGRNANMTGEDIATEPGRERDTRQLFDISTPERVTSAILLAVAVPYVVVAQSYSFQGRFLPELSGCGVIVLSLLQLVGDRFRVTRPFVMQRRAIDPAVVTDRTKLKRLLHILLWLYGLAGLVIECGLVYSIAIFMVVFLATHAPRRLWYLSVGLTAATVAGAYVLIVQVLGTPISSGPWGTAIGRLLGL